MTDIRADMPDPKSTAPADRAQSTGPNGQAADDDDPEGAVAARLRLVVARLARQLRQHSAGGLTPSQYSALTTIGYAGPLRLGELAAYEAVAPPTITRVVSGLVEAGMVERRGDPEDARSALVAVTDKGREALQSIRASRTAVIHRRLGRLTPEQRSRLAEAVEVLERLAEVGDE